MTVSIKKPLSWIILIGLGAIIGLIAALNLELSVYIALGFLCILLPIMFLRPIWGLIILLIIRPSLDILGQNLAITISRDLTINLAAILAILVIAWSVYYLLKNKTSFGKIPLLWPWLIFLGVTAVSIIVSDDRFASLTEWIRLLSIFAIFLVAFDLTSKTKNGRIIFTAILVSAVIPLAVGFSQIMNGQGVYEISTDLNRIPGTFAHPNSLAFYLVLVLALVFILAWPKSQAVKAPIPSARVYTPNSIKFPETRKPGNFLDLAGLKVSKLWLICLVVPALTLLYFTYTRGAWLALGVVVLVLGIMKWKRKFVIFLVIVALVLGLFILFSSQTTRISEFNITRTELYQRFISVFDSGNGQVTSVSWRIQMWSDLLIQAFPAKPLLGHGLGMYVPTSLVVHGYLEQPLEAHNDYVMLLIETGLSGLAAYLFLIISTVTRVIRTARDSANENKKAAIILAATLIAIFAMSFGDNILRMTALQWAMWSAVAVVLAQSVAPKQTMRHNGESINDPAKKR